MLPVVSVTNRMSACVVGVPADTVRVLLMPTEPPSASVSLKVLGDSESASAGPANSTKAGPARVVRRALRIFYTYMGRLMRIWGTDTKARPMPSRRMTEKQVVIIAFSFVNVSHVRIFDRNFFVWEELLSPRHKKSC